MDSPRRVANDEARARRVLDLVGSVPMPLWGRDELRAGEMWNSNSVIAWLLACSGVEMDTVRAPIGGRAPGWKAGLVIAQRQHPADIAVPSRLACTAGLEDTTAGRAA